MNVTVQIKTVELELRTPNLLRLKTKEEHRQSVKRREPVTLTKSVERCLTKPRSEPISISPTLGLNVIYCKQCQQGI